MFLSNVRSLIPKLDEICVYTTVNKPDVLIFCETWLNPSVDDRDISIPGYDAPFRDDRCSRRGGGVCLYTKRNLVCKALTGIASPHRSSSVYGYYFPSAEW